MLSAKLAASSNAGDSQPIKEQDLTTVVTPGSVKANHDRVSTVLVHAATLYLKHAHPAFFLIFHFDADLLPV
jgi:hypothetical protein